MHLMYLKRRSTNMKRSLPGFLFDMASEAAHAQALMASFGVPLTYRLVVRSTEVCFHTRDTH